MKKSSVDLHLAFKCRTTWTLALFLVATFQCMNGHKKLKVRYHNPSLVTTLAENRHPNKPRTICLDKSGRWPCPCDNWERRQLTRDQTRPNSTHRSLNVRNNELSLFGMEQKKQKAFQPLDQSMCVPAAPWQTTFQSTCNVFHEVDLVSRLVVGKLDIVGFGHHRTAWRLRVGFIDDTQSQPKTIQLGNYTKQHPVNNEGAVILKMMGKVNNDNSWSFHMHQVDAIASEALLWSPRVIDIYGFCGVSVLNAVADSTLGEEISKLRAPNNLEKGERGTWSSSLHQRLQYARDAALAMADVHSVAASASRFHDGESPAFPMIAHLDAHPNNFFLSDGMVKMSDFNQAELVKYNTTSRGSCLFKRPSIRGRSWQIDSLAYVGFPRDSPEWWREKPLTPSVDVFGLGGILYYILAGKPLCADPFDPDLVRFQTQLIGDQPGNSTYPKHSSEKAILTALQLALKCISDNWRDRPTAKEVATELASLVSEFGK